MKRSVIGFILTATFTLNSYAIDCRKVYKTKIQEIRLTMEDAFEPDNDGTPLQNFYGTSSSVGGLFFVGALFGLATAGLNPVGWVVLGSAPLIIAFPLVYNPIATTPYKRVVKLIDQSYSFKANDYQKPERFLRKSFDQIPEDQNVTIEQFANSIIEANESGKLCEGVLKYRKLNNKLSTGEFDI